MIFDPLSAWLVALIADGITIAGEKGNSGAAAEYHKKSIKQHSDILNAQIRRTKDSYGLFLPELAYERIQIQIKAANNHCFANGQIVIDLDNQEYIIAVLEACAKRYSERTYDEAVKKAAWYKNAAIEARQRKEQYAKELEETRIREAEEQEKQQTMNNICMVIGCLIIVAFILILFS